MIEIKDLHKTFALPGGRTADVLQGIDLTVPDRCITAVVGPSGSGKTTLSKCISLLESPTRGSIRVNGQNLSQLTGEALRRERRAIGTIFQSSALLRRKTAAQNIALPLHYLGVVQSAVDSRVEELLDSVGLPDKGGHYPGQLSGGQRQRIGIARALALHPQVLLSDEATSGLDPQATHAILELLKRLKDQFGLSIILITHEMDAVRGAADHVAVLRHGRIAEQGRVRDLIADPASTVGRELLPVRAQPSDDPALLQLEVRYSAEHAVPADWISLIGEALSTRVSVLGGNIEASDGFVSGRLLIGLKVGPQHATEAVVHQLARLGLVARIVSEPLAKHAARPAVPSLFSEAV